ncbi:hypothetical protein FA10DRAFT_21131 [Acaromyces ingoldii]|uniref:Uncharacterized protein n=1 Tax=Acaromyces ingoldii TaxID=215250 RepID=A0A316YW59_9BASI|nr:hypothetical protein FA10DRAFT_21131 [Acaromyces ingoldii]PWN93421.1 hypothetical protein FA10DRAFT_21131 [Acaromyces ingoldii]
MVPAARPHTRVVPLGGRRERVSLGSPLLLKTQPRSHPLLALLPTFTVIPNSSLSDSHPFSPVEKHHGTAPLLHFSIASQQQSRLSCGSRLLLSLSPRSQWWP